MTIFNSLFQPFRTNTRTIRYVQQFILGSVFIACAPGDKPAAGTSSSNQDTTSVVAEEDTTNDTTDTGTESTRDTSETYHEVEGGLGPWTGDDNVPPSQLPPNNLTVEQAPLFVALGWDDNGYSGLPGGQGTGGMSWALQMAAERNNPVGSGNPFTYDGMPITMSFYFSTSYIATWHYESPALVKRAWRNAFIGGHEVGNHTHNHANGGQFSVTQWQEELDTCTDWLGKPFDPEESTSTPDNSKGIGVPPAKIYGFRAPFLEYTNNTFSALRNRDFRYDCTIEDGYQADHDGTNYHWPYTLDNGSSGHDVLVAWGVKEPITGHPGLWELPAHPVVVPPDDKCQEYGVPQGFRSRIKAVLPWFDESTGKVTGLDYTLWIALELTKSEVLAILKYTLDLRIQGNHAPFMFGTHSDFYASSYAYAPNATLQERQEAIEEFVDYALSHDFVRVVSMKEVLDWVRNPSPLQ